MKEPNYWQRFLNTGRVDDYLSYLTHREIDGTEKEGENPNAGTFHSYRDDIEGGAFRGI
ncbi:MAG: hypothetical protein HFI47_00070 [Lachnospiraceae bacterium]|nr:hypothetical protein [Lachnospiraceae bacterium]